ncbi:hypothetical protein [Polaromonas sp. A23]|uniref:hypothetical protein n=1 Tax=Polaromonas sp. A23 TaxID=1944133 RepID=UPI000985B29F|nr:hypothetical protein [Polaromonas sp. A23]
MNKPNISLVLAALLATSGFAMAQTSPASAPPFKADGSGVVTTPATGDAKTRADVKAGINAPNAAAGSPTQDARARSEASVPATGGATQNSRADVKAEAGTSMKPVSSTAAERKAARAERKAARKAEAPIPTAKEAGGAASKTNAP